jgi:hypothetical protein
MSVNPLITSNTRKLAPTHSTVEAELIKVSRVIN